MEAYNYAIICMLVFSSLAYASDVSVWQGQYYTGTTFNTGTYEFNFTVYDDLTGGNACFSNTTTLTTGSFGEWKTEQSGVGSACNNVSEDYYLNINIDGIDQTPRRRLVVWDSLRKNVNETSSGSIEIDILKVKVGLKDLNHDIWQSKLTYARELANTTLIAQQEYALKLVEVARNMSLLSTGESIELKKARAIGEAELAKKAVEVNFEIAQAKIVEARKLAQLNGEDAADVAAIEAEAALYLAELNLAAQQQIVMVDEELNDTLASIEANDTGVRYCLSDGTNCQNTSPETDPHWTANESRVAALETSNTTTNDRITSVNSTLQSLTDLSFYGGMYNASAGQTQTLDDADTWYTTEGWVAGLQEGWYMSGDTEMTCNQSGIYSVTLSFSSALNANGELQFRVVVNGIAESKSFIRNQVTNGNYVSSSYSFLRNFTAGDTVRVEVKTPTSSGKTLITDNRNVLVSRVG